MSWHDPYRALPRRLHRAAGVRELDRLAIEEQGIAGFELMRRAGRAAFRCLLGQWPETQRIVVLCGSGNNGGDGYVIAAQAKRQGMDVRVLMLAPVVRLQGSALAAYRMADEAGVVTEAWASQSLDDVDVVVDAMLGTGLSGDVRGDYVSAIDAVNASTAGVLAVDIPSGLDSDTGRILGTAVRAAHTATFIGMKQGLLTGSGPACCGRIHFDDLGVSAAVLERVGADSERLDLAGISALLRPRPRDAHKGGYGHVLVIGGDEGTGGAALMAAMAAGRVGAGLVSLATHPAHISAAIARAPEVMVRAVTSSADLAPMLERASVVVLGPGLGRRSWAEQLVQRATAAERPLVVDADALNLLAEGIAVARSHRDDWVLTPHPGEASRLLCCATVEIQHDRFAAAEKLQQRYGGVCVLKGAGSLVVGGDGAPAGISPYGNPGMASGGMGDVLSGVIGGLIAQGLTPANAARLGVCVHAAAGDIAAADGERGMLATDLLSPLRWLVNREH